MKAIELIDSTIEMLSSNTNLYERYSSEIDGLKQYKDHWKQDKIRIGVIGVTSSGKSTLINTILGDKLLSMAVKPSSSQLVSCSQSETKQATVYFENQKIIQLKGRSLNEKNIKKYSDENYNSNNKEKVAQLELSTPTFELGSDVLLIDSPGLDAYGLENHEELTLEVLLPTIDICVFVTTLKNNSDEKMRSILNLIAKYKCPLVIVQNMLDSLRPSVDGKKSVEEVALDHKRRVERIIAKSNIEEKKAVKVVQMSAIQALRARCENSLDKEKELEKSNYNDLVNVIKETLRRERPAIENQRLITVSNRIKKIVDEGREDIGIPIKSKEIKFEYEGLDIEISYMANKVEEALFNLLNNLDKCNIKKNNSRINSKEDYTEKDINIIKENVKACEKLIIKSIGDFNRYLRIKADTLNIPPRDIISVNGLPNMPDIKLSTKVEMKRTRYKKSGFGSKVGRFFGAIFDNDWGYGYKEESVTVIDNASTKKEIEKYISRAKLMYSREIESWTKKTRVPINQLISKIENRRNSFEERKISVIEKERLIELIEQLDNLHKNVKLEKVTKLKNVKSIDYKSSLAYTTKRFDLRTYNIAKISDKVSNTINININNLLLETNNCFKNNWIVIGWDIISICNFAKRYCGIVLNQKQLSNIEKNGYFRVDKYKFYFNPSKKSLEDIIGKTKSNNIYVLSNATQYGSAQNQIHKCGIGDIVSKKDFLAFVVQDFVELINGNGVGEAINNMMSLTQSLKIDHDSFILISHDNPIYNLVLVESQLNPTKIEKEEVELIKRIQKSFKYLRNEKIDKILSEIIRATSKKGRLQQ